MFRLERVGAGGVGVLIASPTPDPRPAWTTGQDQREVRSRTQRTVTAERRSALRSSLSHSGSAQAYAATSGATRLADRNITTDEMETFGRRRSFPD